MQYNFLGLESRAPTAHRMPLASLVYAVLLAGGHTLRCFGAQQKRDGDEGLEGEGGRGDDDFGAVVVQGLVPGGQGMPLPGGEQGGREQSPEG